MTDYLGLHANFYLFAILNNRRDTRLFRSQADDANAGYDQNNRFAPRRVARTPRQSSLAREFRDWVPHSLCLIGTFTYVNFVLVRPPILLSAMSLGLVYFVFVPAIATTPFAGYFVKRIGPRVPFWSASLVALAGLPLLLSENLARILCGLVLVGAGTFFAQAVATGFVGRAASTDRAAASGIYLACYYFGGVAGSALSGSYSRLRMDRLRCRDRRGLDAVHCFGVGNEIANERSLRVSLAA